MKKALFLDRDGVVNYDYGYVYKICDFVFRPEIFDICKKAKLKHFKIIIVTNQAGIGRKLYSENDYLLITKYMLNIFEQNNIKINDVYHCPFHPTEGINLFLKDSYERKPNPGMILKAAFDHNIRLDKSIMIGDKNSDLIASRNANIKYYVDSNNPNWKSNTINLINKY
jgi:D-glycero-D-manno-heptose 1,7-bisphosphate phosphatase